jgi:LysR family hydrogen peroxide-inducible transcriptional activator
MEMHQIRYFLAVCSERSFTRAAGRCNVTQPSLTRAIKLLEAELGGALFRREHAHSPLTELGEIVRPHLEEAWQKSQTAMTHAREFSAVGVATLRIGVMTTVAPPLLADLIARVRMRHDSFAIEITDGLAADLLRQLLDGQIDAAILCHPALKADARLIQIPLAREPIAVAVSNGHRLACQSAVGLAEFAGEIYVHRPHCELKELVSALLRKRGLQPATSFSCERDDLVLALVSRGAGVALLPRHSIDHPGVVCRPLADVEIWRDIELSTVRGQRRNRSLRALLDEAAQLTTDALTVA